MVFEGSCEEMAEIPDAVVQTCVTSPPYWGLRDYGVEGQLGLEDTPEEYVERLVSIFREVRRVLRGDGTLWLNLGDSYYGSGNASGHTDESMNLGKKTRSYGAYRKSKWKKDHILKPKDLVGIPWMVAFALRADGWYLRSEIIWEKSNPSPESPTDRPTRSHETIFELSRVRDYYYDYDAVTERSTSGLSDRRKMMEQRDRIGADSKVTHDPKNKTNASTNIGKKRAVGKPGVRNRRTVWKVASSPFKGAHFATFPPKLIEPCILAGSAPGDLVLDPFMGSGTTAMVALKHRRHYTGYELNPDYHEIIRKRLAPFKNQTRLTEEGNGW